MRIISGTHKGRRITAPKKLPVRPTTDFAKEALFNIFRNKFDFSELKVLDLFAGTGNISFEFASRGVSDITSVDADYSCVQFIKKTSEELDFSIQALKADVFKFILKNTHQYDVIFADPPYDVPVKNLEIIVEAVFKNKMLLEDGLLIIEHGKQTSVSSLKNYSEMRKYGSSIFSFFSV